MKLKPKIKSANTDLPKPKLKIKFGTKPKPKVAMSALERAKRDLMFKPKQQIKRILCDLRKETGLIQAVNYNQKITDVLTELIDITKKLKAAETDRKLKMRHGHRITSFVKAIDAIRSHPNAIKSGKDAMALKNVGKGVAGRVDEILQTGTLKEITDVTQSDPRANAITKLCSITGIGEVRAATLYDKFGIDSVDELLSQYKAGTIKVAKNQLTHHIVVGLEFYKDLEQRIPWSEVDDIRGALDDLIGEIDDKLVVTVCGSYRRKQPTCGDIDVLVTHPEMVTAEDIQNSKTNYLAKIVDGLSDIGMLVGHLTERGKTKYMGVCRLEDDLPGRRIDIRFVPQEAHAAALLYFTGSGQLNKIMRYRANQLGYTINEYGIYRYSNGVKGTQVPVNSEKEIFDIIDCVYLEPTERQF